MPRKDSTPPPDDKTPRKKRFVPKKTRKYDYEQVRDAIIKNDGLLYQTAAYLDINVQTLYSYKKLWPGLANLMKKCRKSVKNKLEERLFYIALNGDMYESNTIRSIFRALAGEMPEKYGSKKEVNNVNQINVNTTETNSVVLTVEKRDAIISKAREEMAMRRKEIEKLRLLEYELNKFPVDKEITPEIVERKIIENGVSPLDNDKKEVVKNESVDGNSGETVKGDA